MVTNRIPAAELRWRCPGKAIEAAGDEVTPWATVERALRQRLEHALAVNDWRQAHVFVRGPATRHRAELVGSALKQLSPSVRAGCDHCFIHNFDDPNRPRLVRLPAGQGRALRSALAQIGRFIRDELDAALEARPIRNRLQAIADRVGAEMDRLAAPVEARLKPSGLVLVREETGQTVRLTIHVQQTGRVISQDDFANLVAKGQVSREEFDEIRSLVRELQPDLRSLTLAINKSWKDALTLRARVLKTESRRLIVNLAEPLLEPFEQNTIRHHLDAIINDVLETRVDRPVAPAADPERLYGANVIAQAGSGAPRAVHEPVPSRRNLAGSIEPASPEAFHGIRAGSLIAADRDFLVVDAEDLLARPRSVALLRNTLYHGSLVIQGRVGSTSPVLSLRPDPVPIRCRLLLVGTPAQWDRLIRRHPAFSELFADPVDIPETLTRDETSTAWLSRQIRHLAEAEKLLSPDPGALAALIEAAARRGGAGRLDADTERPMALLRRAAAIAGEESARTVTAEHIDRASARVATAVFDRPLPFRFPVRQEQLGRVHGCLVSCHGSHCTAALVQCQASIAPAASFSLRILLNGSPDESASRRGRDVIEALLARTLRPDRPIGLHIVIDVAGAPPGYAPSGRDALLLLAASAVLSELARAPVRQHLAILGSVSADGRIGPVDRLNACIETAWNATSTDHGDPVFIVPASQRTGLMLDAELVQAAANDLLTVVGAGNLDQVVEALTGTSTGVWRNGRIPEQTLYGRARARLQALVGG